MARGAADDAGGLDPGLLGGFLPSVVAAAESGRRLRRRELQDCGERGGQAAQAGVALRALIDLYLSASWRLWDELPEVSGSAAQVRAAGLAVLRAADDGVAALAEGYQLARGDLSRRQESARREVFDALLVGGAEADAALGRAADLGMDLAAPHAVLVAQDVAGDSGAVTGQGAERPGPRRAGPTRDSAERPGAGPALADARAPGPQRSSFEGSSFEGSASAALLGRLQRALQGRYGDASVLLAVKAGRLVVIFAAPDATAVAETVERVVDVLGPGPGWQGAVGRPRPGPDGVRVSYEQARDALELAGRLRLPGPVVDAGDLLVYRVLLRDREALDDLVRTMLGPLEHVRGGSGPLLETLEAFYATGGVATETARRLHLSVRAVTYRLARVRQLVGVDPADPAQRFALQAAVLGARATGWPEGDGS